MNLPFLPGLRHLVLVEDSGDERYLGCAGDGRIAVRAQQRLAAERGVSVAQIRIKTFSPKGTAA